MTEKAHSELGASSAHRWFACPGSIRLSRGLPRSTSIYAAEGTVAHGLAEVGLRHPHIPLETYVGSKRTADGHEILVTAEMVDGVKVYLDAVRSGIQSAQAAHLLIEKKFNLSSVYPGCFGTADAVLWLPEPRMLIVHDFKFGAGIPVEPERNPQQMYYGLGALLETNYPANTVRLCITQPRIPHPKGVVRYWDTPALDLLDFADDLRTYAEATAKPDAPLVPGDHCKFCPAAGICPALKAKARAHAVQVFTKDLPYDPVQLSEALSFADQVEDWAKAVREFAYEEAMRGRTAPGYKLVLKQPRRKWTSEGATIERLQNEGYEAKDIYEPRALKSPAQMEKLVGSELVNTLAKKESSGLTLVHESDSRPAVVQSTAQDVFDVVSEQ